tara:strand:- start:628 stop:1284 length:657 start_codon:yes stop_codon:yes gene_type:complete
MILDIRYDFDRQKRIGIIEAIWGEHKNIDQLKKITEELLKKNEFVFITRIDQHKAKSLKDAYRNAIYFNDSRCLIIGENPYKIESKKTVAIVSGGSSDLGVSLEAKVALEIYGISCETFIDIGVAGLHRLLSQLDKINKHDLIIVCAGMEGALATVLGGLLPQPIIGVPVSVGYGVSKNGLVALNSMLASCSPGITVMNIDNGYGAAMAAIRIINNFN